MLPLYRLRKAWLEGAQIGVVGPQNDLTYPSEHLGDGPEALAKLLKGGKFVEKLAKAHSPAVVVGSGVLQRADRNALLQQVALYLVLDLFTKTLHLVQLQAGREWQLNASTQLFYTTVNT